VEYLVAKGADVNQKDIYGSTALAKASSNGHKEIVEYLVVRGANVNVKDCNGKMAIDLAKDEEIKEILNKKMQELPIKKRSSYIDRIKRGFGLGD
jgi:ankyrin repeat protein